MNIVTLLKETLIGKEIRVCVYNNPIHEIKTKKIRVPGATNLQVEANPERFTTEIKRRVCIGHHRIYETHTITDIVVGDGEDGLYIMAVLSNGYVATLPPYEEIPYAVKP